MTADRHSSIRGLVSARTLRMRSASNWQRFRAANRVARSSVVGDAPAIVSLTTYGDRISTVFHTIESIGRGSVKPRRLVLWLDHDELARGIPVELHRLVSRGLEVRGTMIYRSHKKYYPAISLIREASDELSLVTADDDVYYPHRWLEGLVSAKRCAPGEVHCYRAWRIRIAGGKIARYGDWSLCRSTIPSLLNFAVGVSGVIYPTAVVNRVESLGERFMDYAPRADDVWLHSAAVETGTRVHQINADPAHYPFIPGTQDLTLAMTNVEAGGNDEQIRRTYSPASIETLNAHATFESEGNFT